MKDNRVKYRLWLVAILIMLALWGTVKFMGWSLQQKFDLGNKPPSQVFTRIFCMPVPTSIFNIKVAGEAHLSGVFWMRFQTHDMNAVIFALKRNPVVPVLGPTADPHGWVPLQHDDWYKDRYAAVGWKNAFLIKKPEYYEFSTVPTGTGWWGVLIVDRQQEVVYVRGELL